MVLVRELIYKGIRSPNWLQLGDTRRRLSGNTRLLAKLFLLGRSWPVSPASDQCPGDDRLIQKWLSIQNVSDGIYQELRRRRPTLPPQDVPGVQLVRQSDGINGVESSWKNTGLGDRKTENSACDRDTNLLVPPNISRARNARYGDDHPLKHRNGRLWRACPSRSAFKWDVVC
ncbi:hypothetical protein CLAIMM_14886 isoform 3 [Cladophialophora immunda]|nr:hypothetical protein CLAIMM_14886 isoform 1 [Cladophialophora immunda]OQV10970.1 hypothetical protein CLAIMM_14886 isoform 2 [Cladophialophora immunda]OQV10971.1 hypothetical protein CLAIMM_14886 isoform 3 [Cladophialophora immunda]